MRALEPANTALVPATSAETSGARSLAREMVRAYRRLADSYRTDLGLPPAEADAAARGVLPALADGAALPDDPETLDWSDVSALAETDPARMEAVWDGMVAEASAELASGNRAAAALEYDGRPWERAQFLVLRASFHQEWLPRGGIEAALLDTLAVAMSEQLR